MKVRLINGTVSLNELIVTYFVEMNIYCTSTTHNEIKSLIDGTHHPIQMYMSFSLLRTCKFFFARTCFGPSPVLFRR
jgi:hypothetical protein